MAQVVSFTSFGDADVLELHSIPTPTAPAGAVVVAVRSAGVNPLDCKIRAGLRPTGPITTPRVPGLDASGEIVEVGDGVDGWSVGDAVIISGASGTYTSHLVALPGQLTAKPDALGWDQAAALGIPIGTAYQVLKSLDVHEGTVLLIHGGSGAVGQAAVQFARLWGATVIATASERNHARLAELGAIPVAYGDGLVDRIRSVAPDGIDRVLDAVGTDEAFAVSFELLSDRSQIGTIVMGARAAELGIRAWSGGNPVPLTDEELALRREAVGVAAELAVDGRFQIEIGARYPLAKAADAHRASEQGSVRGKIVLVPGLSD
ncbi:MAG: NADP-dependent oxidoreductase [Burkholderiaceae bacterium]|nr:NADP-dependent oxidoreductase [Microbacteriaceae bacterium]